jgi:D-3-phosphoglycerate dehydrogenase
MKTVLLPEPIRPEGRRLLEGHVRIVEAPDHTPETLKKFIRDAHGIILRTGARITAEIIAAARHLHVIARTGAGVDNVDVKAATERKILVCYVPDANVVSVAEHVMSLLLALSKQLKLLDEEVRGGNFAVRYRYLSTELWGKTLGVIGLGKIGREVAQKARNGFGMKVVAYDPYVSSEETKGLGVEPFDSLTDMLSQSDAVTLHVPLTEQTRGLMGVREFRSMKPSAWFINASRGGLVEEAALVDALDSDVIAGAGLDVFEAEPLDPESPLTRLSNVILTPHVAGLTIESSIRMAVGAAEAVLDVFEGRTPAHVFNRNELMNH